MVKKCNVMSGTQVKHMNSNQWEDRVISGNEWTRGAIFKSVTHFYSFDEQLIKIKN